MHGETPQRGGKVRILWLRQQKDIEPSSGSRDDFQGHRGLGKGLDLLTNNLDSSLVSGVELKNPGSPQLRSNSEQDITVTLNDFPNKTDRQDGYPNISRQRARTVEVFPVPGGP